MEVNIGQHFEYFGSEVGGEGGEMGEEATFLLRMGKSKNMV